MNILIMGPAGAGKGTMSDLILKEYDIPHISTGDMLRENVRNNTELGKMAKSYMEAGKLVPDDVINAMVEDRLQQPDCQKGYLLDGFPRTLVPVHLYRLRNSKRSPKRSASRLKVLSHLKLILISWLTVSQAEESARSAAQSTISETTHRKQKVSVMNAVQN